MGKRLIPGFVNLYINEAGELVLKGIILSEKMDILGVTSVDFIKDAHIDWGTGAGQVSAADVPIADTGGGYDAADVEGALQELVACNITKTVGSGKDFSTIQAAIAWFQKRTKIVDCIIDVDAGSYDEAVSFQKLNIQPGSTLTLRGDTRILAGLSYISSGNDWQPNTVYVVGDIVFVPDPAGNQTVPPRSFRCTTAGTSGAGAPAWNGTIGNTTADNTVVWTCRGAVKNNRAGLTNGGGAAAYGQLVGAAGVPTITVKMYTAACAASNPDLDADGWGNGDTILVYDNAGTVSTYTIDSVVNNVVTLTASLTNSIGNDGAAFCLKPDRTVVQAGAGTCVTVNAARGIVLDGWFLNTAVTGVAVTNGGSVICKNTATDGGVIGFISEAAYCWLSAIDGACSAWESTYGGYTDRSTAIVTYLSVVKCSYGFFADNFSMLHAGNTVMTGCTGNGARASMFSLLRLSNATARNCGTGYYALNGSMLYGNSTDANNCGNTTNYNPAPGAIPGYGNGNGNADLYAS